VDFGVTEGENDNHWGEPLSDPSLTEGKENRGKKRVKSAEETRASKEPGESRGPQLPGRGYIQEKNLPAPAKTNLGRLDARWELRTDLSTQELLKGPRRELREQGGLRATRRRVGALTNFEQEERGGGGGTRG